MENADEKLGFSCSRCGQPLDGVVAMNVVNSSGEKAKKVCARCLADEHANSLTSIEEVDRFIEEVTGSIESLERIIAMCPETLAIPKGMEGAMTPISMYRTFQIHLAAYKSRRMELMTEMDSKTRIDYELSKAILAEEYERAAELKRRSGESSG